MHLKKLDVLVRISLTRKLCTAKENVLKKFCVMKVSYILHATYFNENGNFYILQKSMIKKYMYYRVSGFLCQKFKMHQAQSVGAQQSVAHGNNQRL